MQKLDDDFVKLIHDTIAGDDKAFRKMVDVLEDKRVWEQRDLLLEALPINNESNSNTRTLRALILFIDVPNRTLFQTEEAALLIRQAADEGNPVALVNKAIFYLTLEDPVMRYEAITLLKQAAVRQEPLALSLGMKMFEDQNVTTFAELITQLDAQLDANRPSSFQP